MDKKIIIIEDNQTAFDRLKENVQHIGEVVVAYEEIDDALTHHTKYANITKLLNAKYEKYQKDISLFIIDLKLSGDSADGGINAIIDIRKGSKNDYWRSIVPIIVYTGFMNYEKKALDAKADVVMKKYSKIDKNEKEFDTKPTWKEKLNNHLMNELLPVIRTYCNWYESTIDKIEKLPTIIQSAAIQFYKDHKNPYVKYAFIMTSFEDDYIKLIEKALNKIKKDYFVDTCIANVPGGVTSDDLFVDVRACMHCCDFGIGVFFDDSKKGNKINPNLSLEVGYMLSLGKDICYLKDDNLPKLPIDLASKLYTLYNNSTSTGKKTTMTQALMKWIESQQSKLGIEKRLE